MAADLQRINNTIGKMAYYLQKYNSICVGVSGGSDSNIIVHMIATNFREFLPKIHFVFENTGLEYRATLKHLEYIEERYGIHIDRVRGESVVTVVRREGIPMLSKEYSEIIEGAQKGQEWALKRITRTRAESPYAFSKEKKRLAKYLIDNEVKVSSKCCTLSKKNPHKKYLKSIGADLTITGERKCENGIRAVSHKDCFEERTKRRKYDKYMPLFFWDDETKQYYKEHEGIVYSDCYEVWGMERTGCVGCPFNAKIGRDLKLIKQYEPGLYNACLNVFGESYRIIDQFDIHKIKIFDQEE